MKSPLNALAGLSARAYAQQAHGMATKPRKLIILGALLLVGLISGAGAICAWRIQVAASAFRPAIQEKLSLLVGAPVTVGEIHASLLPRASLSVEDVRVGTIAPRVRSVSVERLSARASLLPLLSGRLSLSSLVIQSPDITLSSTRLPAQEGHPHDKADAQRRDHLSAAQPPDNVSAAHRLEVQIDRIEVSNGVVRVTDTNGPALVFKDIELDSQLALTGTALNIPTATLSVVGPDSLPLKAAAQQCSFVSSDSAVTCDNLALAGPPGSLAIRGKYSVREGSGSLSVSSKGLLLGRLAQQLSPYCSACSSLDLSGSADLDLEIESLQHKLSAKSGIISLTGLGLSPSGSLRILGGSGTISLTGPLTKLQLTTTSFKVSGNGAPVSLSAKAVVQPNQIAIQELALDAFNGKAAIPTVITISSKPISLAGTQNATNLSIEALVRALRPQGKHFITGTIASVVSEITSLSLGDPSQLQGEGSILIKDGSLVGLNLASQLMSQISGLPFISDSLRRKVPPEFEKSFASPDTTIRQLRVAARAAAGQVTISQLALSSELFDLTASGTYSVSGNLSLTSELVFNSDFSRALILKVPELKGLANSADRIVVPLMVRGQPPALIVVPDLTMIARAASSGALQSALEKSLSGKKGIGKDLRKVFGL
jgi:hypothetical protein